MILAHSLLGLPIAYAILRDKEKNFSRFQINFLYLVGVFSSVLPDFDISLMLFFKDLNHRYLISHSFFPYLIIFFILFALSFYPKRLSIFLRYFSFIFLAGVTSHLILDFFVGGIVLFAPFDFNLYGFPISFHKEYFWQSYFTSQYLFYELIFFIPFLFYIFNFKKTEINRTAVLVSSFLFFIALIIPLILSR